MCFARNRRHSLLDGAARYSRRPRICRRHHRGDRCLPDHSADFLGKLQCLAAGSSRNRTRRQQGTDDHSVPHRRHSADQRDGILSRLDPLARRADPTADRPSGGAGRAGQGQSRRGSRGGETDADLGAESIWRILHDTGAPPRFGDQYPHAVDSCRHRRGAFCRGVFDMAFDIARDTASDAIGSATRREKYPRRTATTADCAAAPGAAVFGNPNRGVWRRRRRRIRRAGSERELSSGFIGFRSGEPESR